MPTRTDRALLPPADCQQGRYPLIVNGTAATSGTTTTIDSPGAPGTIRTHVVADPETVAAAATTADGARAECAQLTRSQREEILRAVADGIAADAETLTESLVLEVGKAIRDCRGEVGRCVATLRSAADAVSDLSGREVPVDAVPIGEGRAAFTTYEPVGVVSAITGFNFPLLLAVHKLAAAIGAGCPILIKPSERTPFTTVYLADIVIRAGWPAAAISILNGGPKVSMRMIDDSHVRLVSFTGSSAVGAKVAERAGRYLKRVVLELGSNAATIVSADADLDLAAGSCARGAMVSSGQSCISVQRVLAERSIADELAERIARRVEDMRVGDARSEETEIAGLISRDEEQRVGSLIDDATAHGARIVTGGTDGAALHPTVLADVPTDCDLATDEAFGPVVGVTPYDTLDEAIALANATAYGLMAGVFTASLDTALRLARSIECGGFHINDSSNFRPDNMPYGGVKNSGIGKEGPASAMREMSLEKVITLRMPG